MTEQASNGREQQAVKQPKGTDSQWQKKVELAQRAREMGRSMREGKPKSFRRAVGRSA